MNAERADAHPYPTLAAFLADPRRPEGTLQCWEVHGFVYAVVCAPVEMRESELEPEIFGRADPGFRNDAEREAVTAELTELYTDIVSDVAVDEPDLPAQCRFRPEVMDNFEVGAPVRDWARGFARAHYWLEDHWAEYLADECDDLLHSSVMILSFFAARRLAEAYTARTRNRLVSLESAAKFARLHFRDAMREYAALGRSRGTPFLAPEPAPPLWRPPSWHAERDSQQFCDCGSGKPRSLCCGASLH